MEAVKTHQGKTYAFDATAQGKGLWKQVTKAGKLGKIASKDLQQRWGNPNDSGPLYNQSSQTESEQSNVMKFGGMIKDKTPTPGRLKTFRSMLSDPNETVGSAAIKSIKQRLRPEILVKNLFGKTAGLMAAKGLGVSEERMEAVNKGFSDTPTGFTGKIKGGSAEASKGIVEELHLIRIKSQETYNQIKEINDYFKEKAKKEDIAGDKRAIPTKPMSSSTGGAAAAAPAAEGGGLFDGILGMFGGMGAGGLSKVFTKIWGTLKGVLKKAVTKIPIVGALILAAFGLKDAYDEYVESGDFGSAVGAFFESVADNLTFGLSTSLLGEGGIKNFVKGIVDDTTEMFTKFFDSAKEWLDEYIITPAGEMWETIKTAIGEFSLSETITTISEKIGSAFESIKSFFNDNIITPASNMWEKIKEFIPEFNISEIIDTLKTKFGNAVTGIKDFVVDNLINPIISLPGKIVGGLKSIISSIFEKLAAFELKLPEFTLFNPFGAPIKLGGQSFKPFAGLLSQSAKEEDKGGSINIEEVQKEAIKNLEGAQDQTKSFEMEDTSLGGDVNGSAPATAVPANETSFSERDLAEKDPELYEEFKARREELKQKRLAELSTANPTIANQEANDYANAQAIREFSERAKGAAAPVTAVPIQPVPPETDLRNMPPTGLPVPQPRTTGQAIQQSAQDLAATQSTAQTPAAPVVVNNTTNNTTAGGGGNSGPVAPVRNEDPSMQRAMMDSALMAAF